MGSSLVSNFFENIANILRDMWACKLRSILALFGIMWGTISVVLLLSLGDSFYGAAKLKLTPLANGAIIGLPSSLGMSYKGLPKGRQVMMKAKDIVELPKVVKGVASASPVMGGFNKASTFLRQGLVSIGNINGADYDYMQTGNMHVQAGGRQINDQDVDNKRDVIFLGSDIARALFPRGENPIGKKVYYNHIPFVVIGVQQKDQPAAWNNRFAYIPYSTYIDLFGEENVWLFWVMPQDPSKASYLQDRIAQHFARKFYFDPADKQAVKFFDARKLFEFFQWFFSSIQLFLAFCGALTLAVGGISVANMMFLIVTERTPEIGLKIALGAKDRHILGQILLEAFVIVFLGGLLGIFISSVFIIMLGYMHLPAWLGVFTLSLPVLGATILVLAIVAFLSGLFPALKASRLEPVEALAF